MCGLIGVYNGKSIVNTEKFETALGALKHRGPDKFGSVYLENRHLALGHARLAIRDLSDYGNQPMFSDNGRYSIIFNGEIDNFQTLRHELKAAGYIFKSSSDTEVLLYSFIHFGDQVINHLQGCFALAIYDCYERLICLLRDQSGEKPLYYSVSDKDVLFASELEALILTMDGCPKLDNRSMLSYFSHGFSPIDKSLIEGVLKVRPGEMVKISLQDFTLRSVVARSARKPIHRNLTENKRVDVLKTLLTKSLSSILENDVSTATLLSGGLDSSLVTALCHQQNDGIPAYHVSFPGSANYDESLVAKQVAKHIGVKLIEVPITELKFSTFEKIIDKLDEPFVDTSILPTYLVAEAVGLDHKIAITGDGADEIFGGYKHYQRALRLQKLRNLPMFSTHFFELLSMIFHLRNKTRYARWSENCKSIIKGTPFYNMHLIDKPLFEKLFSNESYDAVRQQSLVDVESINSRNYVKKLMQFDYKNYMVGDVLTKVDRASMMNSVEFRTPFLNQEVVCFANSLPIGDNVDLISRKKIVTELAASYLPSDYNFHRKAGFSIPVEDWLITKNISERIFEYLRQNNSIFTIGQLDEVFKIQKQRGGLAEFIIGIWIFEKWRNRLGVK